MSQFLSDYFNVSVQESASIQKALSKLSGSRCLITGANGIIAYALSRLVDAHSSADLLLATRNSSYPGSEMLSSNAKHVKYDALSSMRYDYVFHCATYSQPAKFLADWASTIRLSTNTLLDLLALTDQKLIFTSSTEIYSGLNKEATENDNGATVPQHTRGIYIESKRVAEAACARSGIGMASRIALAAGPYPGKDDSRVMFELIRRARANKVMTLLGGHQNIRQYQYTGACALRMLVSGILGKEMVYNNAGPHIDTLENFAKKIANQMGIPYQVNEGAASLVGAPDSVRISMNRFHMEFPDMKNMDPTFDNFIKWVIEDCH